VGSDDRTAAAPRERLRRTYWIGGGSGAGKSTVARRLASSCDLRVYDTDEVMPAHAGRLTAEEAPHLAQFAAMDMDERWARRSPEVMFDTFHWYRGEGFHLVVEDLVDLAPGGPVVAEGFRLLPSLVAPLLADPARAVWLLPTPRFRRAALDARGSTWDIPGRTGDPERALRNLLERDRMFTDRLAEETRRLGLPAVHVEVGTSEDELVGQVAQLLGPGARGPTRTGRGAVSAPRRTRTAPDRGRARGAGRGG
jgi:2-phosphoglycerate kinase